MSTGAKNPKPSELDLLVSIERTLRGVEAALQEIVRRLGDIGEALAASRRQGEG